MNPIWKFVGEWLKEWWELMGCAAFTFLGIYIAKTNRGSGWVVGSSAALAAVFAFVAAYRIWKRQYDAYQGELKRNELPEIIGEICGFAVRTTGEGNTPVRHFNFLVTFSLSVCNQRSVVTNIRRVDLDGSCMASPCTILDINVHAPGESPVGPVLLPRQVELHRGVEAVMFGNAVFDFESVQTENAPTSIDLKGLKVSVVDGFGHSHPLAVRDGETLTRPKLFT